MDIDPFWTAAGLAATRRHGIDCREVLDVIEADTSVNVWSDDIPTRIMFLGGRSDRVIVVTIDREYRETTRYGITDVRHANQVEASAWEKRQR